MKKNIVKWPAFNGQTKKSISVASKVLRSIGNERRLLIMCYLLEKERHVGELEGLIGISQSALSQHLARLRRDQLVQTRRDAQCVYYSIAKDRQESIASVINALCGAGELQIAAA
jgi:ArsR family transcriptional regulator, virulence genes transcriptional regulator